MTTTARRLRLVAAGAVLAHAIAVLAAPAAWAQGGAPPAGQQATAGLEVEPVTCWWRGDVSAVRVGEPFGLTLTCSILAAEATRVVLDESRLDAGVVQLPPFDVVSGDRADDLITPGRRYIQYRYIARLIAENAFGAEAVIPPIQLTYRIESRVAQGDAVQGRDLAYAMAPLPVRVQSLVPNSATDIREAPVVSFADIEATTLRARALRTSAVILFVAGGLFALIALVRLVWSRRAAQAVRVRTLAPHVVLGATRASMRDVDREVRAAGWSPALVGRALAALRIASAYAAGRVVSQRESSTQAIPLDGQVLVKTLTAGSMLVSGSTTPARLGEDGDVALRDALLAFTASHFGRESASPDVLDEALSQGRAGVARVASHHAWWKVAVRRAAARLRGAGRRVWAR